MRIAQITSIAIPVPPPTHGGTELIVSGLTEELVRRGRAVHLYASGDSTTAAALHPAVDRATLDRPDVTAYVERELETRNAFALARDAGAYDLIHAHWPVLAHYFAPFVPTPVLLTYHYVEPHLHAYYRREMPGVQPVCVSRRQAELLGEPDLPVVPQRAGDLDRIPFGPEPGDYAVLVARMVPGKGIAEAIRIARAAGVRLVLVGPISSSIPWSRGYYEEAVAPHVDGDRVVHLAEAPNARVLKIVAGANAFLFPLQWEEPFGLAMAEAMACGTPVIAFPRGSVPETVADGVSGFVVASEAEAVRALADAGSLDRAAVRAHAADRFGLGRMVDGYEALYAQLVPHPRDPC